MQKVTYKVPAKRDDKGVFRLDESSKKEINRQELEPEEVQKGVEQIAIELGQKNQEDLELTKEIFNEPGSEGFVELTYLE